MHFDRKSFALTIDRRHDYVFDRILAVMLQSVYCLHDDIASSSGLLMPDDGVQQQAQKTDHVRYLH